MKIVQCDKAAICKDRCIHATEHRLGVNCDKDCMRALGIGKAQCRPLEKEDWDS
jgi:hypothetical protein